MILQYLLLDEPTASLDPETGDFIRTFLENYKKENKISSSPCFTQYE